MADAPGLRVPSGRALTARVLLVFLAGLLIATGLVGGVAMWAARRGVLAEAHLRAEAQARRIAERISVAAARRTPTAQLLKGADLMFDQATSGRAALLDGRGRVLRGARIAPGDGPVVQARVPIRRLGWTVVVERSRREVTAPLFDTLRRAAAGTALLVTAFAILGALAFGAPLPLDSIAREGITGIETSDVLYAQTEFGYVLKLLGIARR
ncbi:MAG: hypothetical protein AAB368_14370, partial [bacterium]